MNEGHIVGLLILGEESLVRIANVALVVLGQPAEFFDVLDEVGFSADFAEFGNSSEGDHAAEVVQGAVVKEIIGKETAVAGTGDHDGLPFKSAVEVTGSKGAAVLHLSEQSVVDQLGNLAAVQTISVSHGGGDALGQAEVNGLLDVAPRPLEVVVLENAAQHGERVFVADTVLGAELTVAVTEDDALLGSIGESAEVVGSGSAFEIGEPGHVVLSVIPLFGNGGVGADPPDFPLLVIDPASGNTGNEQSHFVSLDGICRAQFAVALALENAVFLEELDRFVKLSSNFFLSSSSDYGIFSNDGRFFGRADHGRDGEGHQDGKDERKNFLHPSQLLMKDKLLGQGKAPVRTLFRA